MNRNIDDMLQDMRQAIENLEKLAKENPEEAKRQALKSLAKCGVLNDDYSPKEQIVDESYIGYEENSMSYEDIVETMKNCMEGLRNLGDGDHDKTRTLIAQSLVDSRFVDRHGHIIVREKRAPHVEAFFRRVEEEMKASGKQRVRK